MKQYHLSLKLRCFRAQKKRTTPSKLNYFKTEKVKNVQEACSWSLKPQNQVPLLGFNTSKYDFKLLKEVLVGNLIEKRNKKQINTKKYEWHLVKFLVMRNFISTTTSSATLVKTVKWKMNKLASPCKWHDCY